MKEIFKITKRVNQINMIMLLKSIETKEFINILTKENNKNVCLEIYAYLFDSSKEYQIELVVNRILKEVQERTTDKDELIKSIQTFTLGNYTFSKDGFNDKVGLITKGDSHKNLGFSDGSTGVLTLSFNQFYSEAGSYEIYAIYDDKVLSVFPFEVI